MTTGITKNQRPVVGDTMSRKDDADEQEQAVAESRGGDSLNRRVVLKRTGQVGAIGLFPVGTAMSSSTENRSEEAMPDTSFDPNDSGEVVKFVSDSFETRNALKQQVMERESTTQGADAARLEQTIQQKRTRMLKELDRQQVQAIGDILKEAELMVESDTTFITSGTESVETQSHGRWEFERFRATINAKLKVPALNKRFDAFRFAHIVEWEANHDWPPKVRAIEPSATGNGKNHLLAYWQYKGATGDDVVVRAGGNYFNSEKTGKFTGCLLIGTSFTCSRHDRAYIEIVGSSNGSGNAVEKRVNG